MLLFDVNVNQDGGRVSQFRDHPCVNQKDLESRKPEALERGWVPWVFFAARGPEKMVKVKLDPWMVGSA